MVVFEFHLNRSPKINEKDVERTMIIHCVSGLIQFNENIF